MAPIGVRLGDQRSWSNGTRIMSEKPKEGHEIFVSSPAPKLGAVRWQILRASTQMHSQTTLKKPAGPTGKIVPYEQTEFGKEVGKDEINQWVFKKKTNQEQSRLCPVNDDPVRGYSRNIFAFHFSPAWIPPAGWLRDNAPSVARARRCFHGERPEIRGDPRLS